ncbi:Uncharacterized protein TPAR_07627 [Tolypocladium paradoxum]|uniref:Dolichol-phosphate mannosyltransferase subunit 3 n=1 Tax=Tolypocladium paradoxum TaxID=94208 RepID=A0A2S4KPR6_9HYPO|nr:Uncharacterized protein TPAR_07627 [Tolypocladium paradoxum]
MTRAQQTISLGLLVSSVRRPASSFLTFGAFINANARAPQLYLALYLELIPLPPLVQQQIVPVVRPLIPFLEALGLTVRQLPFWALVTFGAILLFRLGWGILTFNDVPEAHKELMQEIDLAKADLRQMGVDVD